MTPRETAALDAGNLHGADMALIAAVALEIRADADHLRKRSAVAALQALAEGLKQAAGGIFELEGTSAIKRNAEISGINPLQPVAAREDATAQGCTGHTCRSSELECFSTSLARQ